MPVDKRYRDTHPIPLFERYLHALDLRVLDGALAEVGEEPPAHLSANEREQWTTKLKQRKVEAHQVFVRHVQELGKAAANELASVTEFRGEGRDDMGARWSKETPTASPDEILGQVGQWLRLVEAIKYMGGPPQVHCWVGPAPWRTANPLAALRIS